MNLSLLTTSPRPTALALTLIGLLAALPAHAGQTCDLNDGNPMTEDTGGSTANGMQATSCGVSNVADGPNSSAYGLDNDATANGANAFGRQNKASGPSSNAFGINNAVSGNASSAFGTNNAITSGSGLAVGFANVTSGFRGAAIGFNTSAIGVASVAVGSFFDADMDGSPTPNVDTDLDGIFESSSELTTAFGDHSTAIGPGAWGFGARSVGIGAGAFATGDDSVAIGSGSQADAPNTVSVGSVGNERRIVNVADGTQATDAVNLQQLQATLATANAYTDTAVATGSTKANAYTDDREAAVRKDMQAGDAQTLSAAKAYTDQKFADLSGLNDRFDRIDRRFGEQDRRISRVGALSAAMTQSSAIAAQGSGARGSYGIGAAVQGGKKALAVGWGKRIGDKHVFTLGGAFSGSERSASIGFGGEL